MPNNKKTVKVVQMKKFNFIIQMVMELCTLLIISLYLYVFHIIAQIILIFIQNSKNAGVQPLSWNRILASILQALYKLICLLKYTHICHCNHFKCLIQSYESIFILLQNKFPYPFHLANLKPSSSQSSLHSPSSQPVSHCSIFSSCDFDLRYTGKWNCIMCLSPFCFYNKKLQLSYSK